MTRYANILMSTAFVVLMIGCGVDQPESSETCGYELLSDAYDEYVESRNEYGLNPTPETCLDLRASVDQFEQITGLIDSNCIDSNWDPNQISDLRNWTQEIGFAVVPTDCSAVVPEG